MQTIDIVGKDVSFYEFLGQKECRRRTLFSVLNDIRKCVYADAVLKLRKNINNKRFYRKHKKICRLCAFLGYFGVAIISMM